MFFATLPSLEQEEVDYLYGRGRLFDFTECPTAAEVNRWSYKGFGHDAVNKSLCTEFKARRAPASSACVRLAVAAAKSHIPKKSRSGIARAEDLQFITALRRDAHQLNLVENSVDLVVTSPPYWRKRDYGIKGQLGQEKTSAQYVEAIVEALKEWRRVLRPQRDFATINFSEAQVTSVAANYSSVIFQLPSSLTNSF